MRRVLSLTLVLMMMVLTCACSAPSAPPEPAETSVAEPPAQAEGTPEEVQSTDAGVDFSNCSGEVVVACWAGSYMELLQKYLEPVLAEIAPNVKVVYSTGNDTDYIAKAIVEKDGVGTYDVMAIGQMDLAKLTNNGIAKKVDDTMIPNLANMYPEYRDDYYISQMYSAGVLIYNENMVSEAPDSWADLWTPEYKGDVAMLSTFRHFAMFASSIIDGEEYAYGDSADWMHGWDRIMALKNDMDVQILTTNEQIGNGLATGEIAMTIGWKARAAQWVEASDEPLAYVLPKEGSYAYITGVSILENAPNPDAACAFVQALLDPRVQEGFANEMKYAPTVNNCTLTPEVQENISFTAQEQERIKMVPSSYVFDNDGVWLERWNKEFLDQ